jgi:hypothetical protein
MRPLPIMMPAAKSEFVLIVALIAITALLALSFVVS